MKLSIMLLLASASCFAQNCEISYETVAEKSGSVVSAINDLTNAGAEVRVRILDTFESPTLEGLERIQERNCPSWQALDGGRKNNLIVVMVAIKRHKTGIYFGSQWDGALRAEWPRIESQIMAPRFRDGDIDGGVVAGLAEIHSLITTRQPLGAVTAVVYPPAIDLSGLWHVLFYGILFAAIIIVSVLLRRAMAARSKQIDDREEAKKAALLSQQEASSLVQGCSGGIIYHDAEQNPEARAIIDAAVNTFSQITVEFSSECPAGSYRAVETAFKGVTADLMKAKRVLRGEPANAVAHESTKRHRNPSHEWAPPPAHPTVIHEHHGTTVVPVFIPEERPEFRSPDPDPPSSPSWGSSDSGSGGSSDWGSSSSDSGGSSDFGSSSSGGGDSSW
jgi:uncharacterized membrane protein YgcG